nr:rRNA large subunit methyltransferase I [Ferruginibacter sp.]
MKGIFLNKNISRRVELGHPWIFANEVNRGKALDAAAAAGEIVNVFTHDKKFIGRGYINPKSQIMVRLLTRDKDEIIDEDFFLNRILKAWEYRQRIGYTENCRLVFGEADDLPQLIIDKFNDHFVIQTLALGIDVWKPAIVKALEKIFSPKGIYERNDVPVRELEGLEQQKGFLSGTFDTNILITENGIRFHVDIAQG